MHPGAQFGQVVGGVVIHAQDGLANRVKPTDVGWHLGEGDPEGLNLVIEPLPQHIGLVVKLPKERSAGDIGSRGEIIDSGLVEAFLGKESQGDDLELARCGARRSTTSFTLLLSLLFGAPVD